MLPIKHRLYDFQGQSYIRDWELKNCEEHLRFINFLQRKFHECTGNQHRQFFIKISAL